ncbi:hypothetical protein Hypma_013224 [Hypsizygus marmoreus]|uniref:Uncharacterized protein n=1 Tax=Hypsizygus marmoreus TaxID=39966 RepID=A0A369JCB8_HYPMA|nr:hypothetical protein Hypma_013224 [Hypsizygus marmoreus]
MVLTLYPALDAHQVPSGDPSAKSLDIKTSTCAGGKRQQDFISPAGSCPQDQDIQCRYRVSYAGSHVTGASVSLSLLTRQFRNEMPSHCSLQPLASMAWLENGPGDCGSWTGSSPRPCAS